MMAKPKVNAICSRGAPIVHPRQPMNTKKAVPPNSERQAISRSREVMLSNSFTTLPEIYKLKF